MIPPRPDREDAAPALRRGADEPGRSAEAALSAKAARSGEAAPEFLLNGVPTSLEGADPTGTLLAWLRARGLTGSKEGCAEGECGACTVAMLVREPALRDERDVSIGGELGASVGGELGASGGGERDVAGGGERYVADGGTPGAAGGGERDVSARYEPVNACLLPLGACVGAEIFTVEGVGSSTRLHPVQAALAAAGGSQCGYCTPGFVVALFAEYYRPDRVPGTFDPEAISGNLCRCTGYRPIIAAAESLGLPAAGDAFAMRLARRSEECGEGREGRGSNVADRGEVGRAGHSAPDTAAVDAAGSVAGVAEASGDAVAGVGHGAAVGAHGAVDRDAADCDAADDGVAVGARGPFVWAGAGRRWHRPRSVREAVALLAADPEARPIAGGTDLLVDQNLRGTRYPALVSLEDIPELTRVVFASDRIEIGAAATLRVLEEQLRGRLPILEELFPLFASRQIRARATLGGNLATASPIGDGSPALLAVGAELRLLGPDGERFVPLDTFFTDYRRTQLGPAELIASIVVPLPLPGILRFAKVSKRVLDDISTVAAGFAIDLDAHGSVVSARLAYGGVAATPLRARAAEAALLGRRWGADAFAAAREPLAAAFSPIDDQRGSAAYRRAMVVRLFEKLCSETAPHSRGEQSVAPHSRGEQAVAGRPRGERPPALEGELQ